MTHPKITIVGAGNVGATCALRAAMRDLGDIVLVDVIEGLAAWKAMEALGKIAHPSAVGPLISALEETDPYMQARAALALGNIRDPRAVQPLIQVLQFSERERREGANAFGPSVHDDDLLDHFIGDKAMVVRMYRAAPDASDRTAKARAAAAEALGRIGHREAVPSLQASLTNDHSDLVRKAATDALHKLGAL